MSAEEQVPAVEQLSAEEQAPGEEQAPDLAPVQIQDFGAQQEQIVPESVEEELAHVYKGVVIRPLTPEESEEYRQWAETAREKQHTAFKVFRRKLAAIITLAVIAFICILCAAIGAALEAYGISASADTISYDATYRHQLDLDLPMTITVNETGYYAAYLYGDQATSSSGTDIVEDGVIFNFAPTTFEIVIPKGRKVTQYATSIVYGRIFDFSLSGPVSLSFNNVMEGSTSEDTSVIYSFNGLTDGTYTLSFTKNEYQYSQTSLGGTYESYSGDVVTTFTFTVDTTAPVINGISQDENNPTYVTGDFTVSATDGVSGVYQLGYQGPGQSVFVWSTINTRSFTLASDGEGLYMLCAKDNAGNSSDYYYVCMDATAPKLTAKGADFNDVTDGSFSVTATDAGGSLTLYWCKTDTGQWYAAEGGTVTIPYTNGDGEYGFYAVDAAGNTSAKYYVTLNTADIEGFFVTNDSDNSQYFYWNNSNWSATMDGEPYEKGTWITDEGDHEIILTSKYGDTLEYSCTIDHYYMAAETVAATCAEEGYTLYCCTHCGDTYKADFVATTKHDYRASYTMPTCTEQGYMTYTCTDCGSSYTDNYTPATGHYYTKTTIEPTCDAEGYCLYECIVCHDSYTTDYTPETDHDYVCTYTAPTCTMAGLYTYTCSICGDTYVEEVGYPTDHTYEITVVSSPTCCEDGERYYRCTVCGYDLYMTIPATGHNYVILTQYTEDGDTMRTYICEDCGDEYTEDLGNQTEYVADYVNELFSKYSKFMWWILLAVAGVWSVVMGIMYIRARRAEDKDKARRMLVNYILGLVIIAVIIVAAPYLAYGIASLAT
ncbi:MAG: pilin [Clostridia bacterium]|nr:pilin [Clostridia bacterium]